MTRLNKAFSNIGVLAALLLSWACVPSLYSTGDDDADGWVAPENSWKVNTPSEDLVEEGFLPGEILPDCRIADQFGDTTSLWQFYGDVMVVDISTMWCGPCQELAHDTQATYEDYKDQGFTYITILAENTGGQDPSNEDVNMWADYYDIEAPVLGDVDKGCTADAAPDGQYPVVLVIDRDMRVRVEVAPSDELLRAAVEEALAE